MEPKQPPGESELQEVASSNNEYAKLGVEQEPVEGRATTSTEFAGSIEPAPEGWATTNAIARDAGVTFDAVEKILKLEEQRYPEWVKDYNTRSGRLAKHYHPELIAIVHEELSKYELAPEGWMTIGGFARMQNVTHNAARKVIKNLEQEYPEWSQEYKDGSGKVSRHYHPSLLNIATEKIDKYEPPPVGWLTATGLVGKLGISIGTTRRLMTPLLEDHPEWEQDFTDKKGHPAKHYHPEIARSLEEEISKTPTTPDGWLTNNALAKDLHVSESTIKKMASTLQDRFPEGIQEYRNESGKIYEHYSPQLTEAIRQELLSVGPAPEGWMTRYGIIKATGSHWEATQSIINDLMGEHPEWSHIYKDKGGHQLRHYHPELVSEVSAKLQAAKSERLKSQGVDLERKQLVDSLENFLSEVSQGDSQEAQEFRKLTDLFGSEQAIDIIFQHHPEYKNIPLPQVKSILGDYLGDFLVIRGDFNFDTLTKSVEYISNPTLKDGLVEVVKGKILRSYNEVKRSSPFSSDEGILAACITQLREQGRELDNADFNDVLDEVENYYRALFTDIHKPDSLIDGLGPDRQFPDINQRINILELASQNKLLIADEMGLGKSASSIIAKETLGVKQALVVVPSNVVEVWQSYLSDRRDADGNPQGYFRPGEAPRVLTVTNYEELQGVNPADYDYVILPQERLNERYMEQMGRFSYDMLIVDEVHKLKNITEGKRAENLIKLAEQINDSEDKYLALLSGTPVPNKVGDIAMVLRLLYPEKFEQVSNQELTNQILQGDMLDLRSLLLPRMQMKELGESVAMPELHQETRRVQLSAKEREAYEVLLEEDELTATQKMQILRQFALNPAMLDATPDLESSKTREVGEGLRDTFATKNKVVMFVNGYVENVIRGERNIIDQLGVPAGVAVRVIDGSVDKYDRLVIQRELQHPDRRMLLLVSGQTADVGVDFSAAEAVDFYNNPWSEYDKHQELRRVYRPGLKDDLTARTYIAEGTIEEGISEYIQTKYVAVEKLLRGIPITDIEQAMLKGAERRADPDVEVNPELARYYFSSWDRMMHFYGRTKEQGEKRFVEFLEGQGEAYAESYNDTGSRSYQANANRLAGTLISRFTAERGQNPGEMKIVDLASGPEMLRRHIPDDYADQVISIDINAHHFESEDPQRIVGSFLQTPFDDKSIDYANLSLALHYTSFAPSRGDYERLEAFKEMNRVLKTGGRGVITLLNTVDLKDVDEFNGAVQKLGFKVVEEHSGTVESGANFRARVITLEKVADCTESAKKLTTALGSAGIRGLKFTKGGGGMRDSRRIASQFKFVDGEAIEAQFNATDQRVLEEEQGTLAEMEALRQQHGSVEAIPRENIIAGGFTRIFNGKRYVLFKGLKTAAGAVVVR
jgi:ubiquinone/menaquinone biosynthesis C-methylase UbiE